MTTTYEIQTFTVHQTWARMRDSTLRLVGYPANRFDSRQAAEVASRALSKYYEPGEIDGCFFDFRVAEVA